MNNTISTRRLVKVCIPYANHLRDPGMKLYSALHQYGIPGYDVATMAKSEAVLPVLRSRMVEEPASLKYDYLFFLDDDMGLRGEDQQFVEIAVGGQTFQVPLLIKYMKQILDHDFNICSGVYCRRSHPYEPLINIVDEDGNERPWFEIPKVGVHRVHSVPTGFLCIKRHVFEKIQEDFEYRERLVKRYEAEMKKTDATELPGWLREYLLIVKPAITPPFWLDFKYHGERRWEVIGEDRHFCNLARAAGIEIRVDCSVQVGHMTQSFVMPGDVEHVKQETEQCTA